MGRKLDLIRGYPDEVLLEEVRRVAGIVEKPILTQSDFIRHSRIAVAMLKERFGDWRSTLERAGVGHMCPGIPEGRNEHRRGSCYPDELLIEEVRRVAMLVGKPRILRDDFTRHSKIAVHTLLRRFGSWHQVLERAGVEHMFPGTPVDGTERASPECAGSRHMKRAERSPRTRYSDEELLEEVQRVAGIVMKPVLTKNDFRSHSKIDESVLRLRFGDWRTILEQAGVGYMYSGGPGKAPLSSRKRLSDEMLLDEIRRVASLVKRPILTRSDFHNYAKINPAIPTKRFGGWPAALELAGVGNMVAGTFQRGHSYEYLVEEVRRVAGTIGKPFLTAEEFRRHSSVCIATLKRRFGDWREVLEHAGVGHMYCAPCAGYTDEMLLEEVRRVAELVGKPVLTNDDYAKHGSISLGTLVRRFGKWRDVLERAGMGHMYFGAIEGSARLAHIKYSDDDLLEELRRVAKVVGNPRFTTDDFRSHSKISLSTIHKRFGDWRNVLKIAARERQK